MKRILVYFLTCLALAAQAQRPSPRQLYPGLFEAVQLTHVYPDNKTFVDALPKQSPAQIMKAYAEQKGKPDFDLRQFVQAYFTAPAAANGQYKSNITGGIRRHVDTLWTVLQRRQDDTAALRYSSLLPLPHPYIVPGGRFREVYYWDSYFTMLGLKESKRTPVIRNMVDNFAYLIDKLGFIPNGNRTYYLTRSQPPFFALMVNLLAQDEGEKTLLRYQPQLLKEYAYWMAGADSLAPGGMRLRAVRMPGGEVLNRYWDTSDQPREESYADDVTNAKSSPQPPAEFYRNVRAAAASGWDFSTRWMGPSGKLGTIQTTSIVPVDLNCLLYALENTIAKTYQIQGNAQQVKVFQSRAQQRKKAILAYCWDEKVGWFVDYNLKLKQRSPVYSLAGAYPLSFEIATPTQATRAATYMKANFLKPGGLVTTANTSGQQWDAPNAWAPLQWMAVDGLEHYNQRELARTVATRWIDLNVSVFQQTGKLMEKYNVLDTHLKAGGGEYPLQDGFGWTNGVLLKMMDQYKVE
ncbi:alpha,alpha-trehalase TreA [Hymenobacter jejuensis]|uniref:Alpha,alpha-trehalase TreA n=1 Tax=Hymenobacter jejuensis TaxID=2502781 RepID=A0A5B7ZY09_9BACT|nr:alpha,alpha-trehalase TreA [Hymenobacter jejuensis]QDA59898.1 alpha,alpha-trehalase TreA [Hymenobacter jejuensis]